MTLTRLWLLMAAVLLLSASSLSAQGAHRVTLAWTDTVNPAGTTYSVYRAAGSCAAPFVKIASGINALTFTDTTVAPGSYCFSVTATVGGVESPRSMGMLAIVPQGTAFEACGLEP